MPFAAWTLLLSYVPVADPSLGGQWEKGFLDGTKSSTRKPAAATPGRPEARQATGAGSAVPRSNVASSTANTESHAFRETVVEKVVNADVTPMLAPGSPAAVVGPRVSRFKARRQGLE